MVKRFGPGCARVPIEQFPWSHLIKGQSAQISMKPRQRGLFLDWASISTTPPKKGRYGKDLSNGRRQMAALSFDSLITWSLPGSFGNPSILELTRCQKSYERSSIYKVLCAEYLEEICQSHDTM